MGILSLYRPQRRGFIARNGRSGHDRAAGLRTKRALETRQCVFGASALAQVDQGTADRVLDLLYSSTASTTSIHRAGAVENP